MPIPDIPHSSVTLLDEEASTRVLKFFSSATLLLLGSAVGLAYLFSNADKHLLAPPALICFLALGTHIGIRLGHTRISGQVLIWGTWTIILVSAPFGSGNRSIGMVAIPLLIFVKGWLGGPRRAIGMTIATLVALLGISLSEHYNWIAQTGPVPPLSRWLMLCAIFCTMGFFTVLSHRLYLRRYSEQARLAATLALVTEHSPIMLASVDADGRYRYVNNNYAHFHGKATENLVGSPVADTVGADTVRQIRQTLLKNGGHGAYRSRRQDPVSGIERWLETSVQQAVGGDGRDDGYYAILRDVTDEVRSAEQINFLAYHDSLTGLPNRALMIDRLHQAILRGQREDSLVVVAYLDLDRFKFLNDTWGHSTGDSMLIQLAARLQDCVRDTDTVARLGGDEFVVLMGGIEKREEIPATVTRLLKAVGSPTPISENRDITISASIGVSVCPLDGEEPEILLRNADQAMLMAKQSGRNRYCLFDTELDHRARTLHQITANVEKGLDTGEFVLFYQPKVNMRLGTVIGVEALIRWAHPDEGLLLPAGFLPYVEGSDSATRLGQWVLTEALSQMRRWAAIGLHLPVSVNISGHHLQAPGFSEHLTHLLKAHPELPPERLEIEIPETTAMDDVEKVARIIRDNSALGVRFALDDFGTGYSSLTYFRQLPAQTLKIDRSFVRDILKDPEDLAIAKGVVALARSFGREVIAEGLETIEHGIPLLDIGCDCAQGDGIAAPMPADALPAWLAQWQCPPLWQETGASRA
ncbi:bifunctional diguanylate cyclase/phosphodiesterase [Zoogloea sp.]|uniref:putative bifunctional diguanylate cyclase/phosphodiesterase n=1 Tax=Zoogloea sp. TaxID=49181 RepID=UPI0025D85943|nr:GGDEF and EAL domain-containing protein [Zoogloea sp.]